MPDVKEPIQEVWVVKDGIRQRVYRGRRQSEVDWKMNHHKNFSPELVKPGEK